MKTNIVRKNRKPKIQLLHQYYSYTGFYQFIGATLKKVAVPFAVLVGLILFLEYYVLDFHSLFHETTKDYSPISVFMIFFTSESILGLIPPELFIAWVKTLPDPMLQLSLLALLSYLGGCVSYFIGKTILSIPSVKKTVENKMKKHITNLKKWGGLLIVVGALLPLPFSMVSMASGIINFSFKRYLLFGLFRFLRFYLFALAIFNIMN
ncbi:short-chain dehydrogenase [Labilibaculum sp. A4]|uniref:Short-chain dehydrogenase n=1 Tax=Labilibaculum euxinus TaxID=2686357 RepID=A0A425Y987_9BACT|nr:VTT domain-containing protein [Labilibaculum euxinus]MDQ1770227.1 VTT domain-containing protein [Labilibaculum euxinus]MUP37580.1 short-chain dehydrogenase [Labilibaculum euxinus]MVB06785.1 short-chain dehydrogenase [Labilibaculum euxinus]MWN77558.1 short-chain dehydrogenase [Labilibaculum euxinus]